LAFSGTTPGLKGGDLLVSSNEDWRSFKLPAFDKMVKFLEIVDEDRCWLDLSSNF
jgi:streptogramin lyase